MSTSRRAALAALAAVTLPGAVKAAATAPAAAQGAPSESVAKRFKPTDAPAVAGSPQKMKAATPPSVTPPPSPSAPESNISALAAKDRNELAAALSKPSSVAAILPDPNIHNSIRYDSQISQDSFRWNHADLLVADAGGLLSRCLDARSEWQDRYLKYHTFLFELEQFEALDRIHARETEAGFYEVENDQAGAELDAASRLHKLLSSSLFWLTAARNQGEVGYDDQVLAQTILGWISHVSAYPTEGDATRRAIFNDDDKTVLEHCQIASNKIANYNLGIELERLRAEEIARSADVDSLIARLRGLQSKYEWEARNVGFRRSRTDALRSLYDKKRSLLSDAQSGLNFKGQLDSALFRCRRDFSDGVAHVLAAARGLKLIFGYPTPLPRSVAAATTSKEGAVIGRALDDAVTWARDASSWLARFSQRDSVQTLTLSLNKLAPDMWNAFRKSGNTVIRLSEDIFPAQSHVRFRGVAVHTVGGKGVFGASLSVPRSSFYRMNDGSKQAVDQRDVPLLRIGAVRDYESSRPPEMAGMSAAYNVSPIGDWSLSLSDLSTSEESLSNVRDILIELAIAARN